MGHINVVLVAMFIPVNHKLIIYRDSYRPHMTDVMLIWDTPLLFEKLFLDNGLKCQRILSHAVGTPFLPPCKCIIIPTGFANPDYTKIVAGIERNGRTFEKFVKNGGILVVFGPMVPEYHYDWLPMELMYVQEHGLTLINKVGEHGAQCIITDIDMQVECDGYFSKTDGDADVLLNNAGERPVMVAKNIGDGIVIATTIHEFPSADFLSWVMERAKMSRV
ncbi:MAG: hypothetical protein KAI86_00840 [Desulfobacterales bacterium]|nr:hypothetical protein [Desulfobacterales bacterium]